jgi:hypothetical protein
VGLGLRCPLAASDTSRACRLRARSHPVLMNGSRPSDCRTTIRGRYSLPGRAEAGRGSPSRYAQAW